MGGSGSEDASATDGLDSPFSGLAEELGLDDHGLVGEASLAQDLEETGFGDVDDGHAVLVGSVFGTGVFADEAPLSSNKGAYDFVDVDCWLEELVALEVEESHTLLTEVAGMVSIEESSHVGETTSVT